METPRTQFADAFRQALEAFQQMTARDDTEGLVEALKVLTQASQAGFALLARAAPTVQRAVMLHYGPWYRDWLRALADDSPEMTPAFDLVLTLTADSEMRILTDDASP